MESCAEHVPEGPCPGNLTVLATDKNSIDSFLATAVEQLDEAPMIEYISLKTNNFSLVVKNCFFRTGCRD